MRLYNNDEYREEFMERVYSLLSSDGTNDRANQIIDAFDAAPAVEVDSSLLNAPLTIDELWRMDGLPVWAVDNKLTAKCALVYSPCGIVYLTFGDRTRLNVVDLLDHGCKIYRDKPDWCD